MAQVLQKYRDKTVQREALPEEDELLQGKFETAQREELDDEELLQGKLANGEAVQRETVPNNTGLPDNLKSGGEHVAQRWPISGKSTDKYPYSNFQSSAKQMTVFYMLYDSSIPGEPVEYIGKTIQQGNSRFIQHKRDKELSEDIIYDQICQDNLTPFEVATYEQFYIGEAGGTEVLMNRINALDIDKWKWFKEPDDPINRDQSDNLTERHFRIAN
jgi:hypothetical protein